MKQYHVEVYNINALKTLDEFTSCFENYHQLSEYMDNIQLHNYDYDYFDLGWTSTESEQTESTPSHYQGTIQPIDLINAQNLNFNLGNVVKYVCRAGKKEGESNLKDLKKAKDYINYEIKRINIKEN